MTELANILPVLKESKTAIIKKGRLDLVSNSGDTSIKEEIDGWIDLEATDEEIFEIISTIPLADNQRKEITNEEKYSKKQSNTFMFNLSNNERKFLILLCQAEGNSLSREELCFGIWGSRGTPSCLSQLSALAKRIKNKLVAFGYEEEDLATIWGSGYSLGQPLVNLLQQQFI